MSELFYINEDGDNVHTAQFLKNRGSCCKTNCLHCPYGTTLKNLGIEFQQVKEEDISKASEIIKEGSQEEALDLGASLIQGAFGGGKKKTTINKFNYSDFYFFTIKGVIAGVTKKGRLQLKEIFLRKVFQNQDLDLDTVQSFF